MDESSSAVRSLLDIGFYLRHEAQPNDLLMVDEPELNLHPENQRRMARLFARLVNLGIKVFITTHSDYIVKELNTLIMLNGDKPHLKQISEKEGYRTEELLSYEKVKVYIAEEVSKRLAGKNRKSKCNTLTEANITSELGIEARSFDTTINEMNRIQEEIVWGCE
jgi:ABC-type multidrug transport system ATPase subunit